MPRIGLLLLFLFAGQLTIAQSARDATVEVSASVQESPPQITLHWPPSRQLVSVQKIYRKLQGAPLWIERAPLAASATSFVDSTVVAGVNYEYFVTCNMNVPGAISSAGYLSTGTRVPLADDRGKVILLVDETAGAPLGAELARLGEDLTGDGWIVLRQDVSRTTPVTAIKATVQALYNADPAKTRALILFGHVPIPYSGDFSPDGHPDHRGAWPADAYYGDVDGAWTDNLVNNSNAARTENRNVPGDGKFDQSVVPSEVELEVGRIDLASMGGVSTGLSEAELLRQYLNRDHSFRHRTGSFANVGRRGLITDEFGYFGGEAFAANGWRNFTSFFGSEPGSIVEQNWFGTLQTESYLCAYACGGGSYTGGGGVGASSDFATRKSLAVFNMLFGSYLGDWDVGDSLLRAPLAGRAESLGLVSLWAGRPHWHLYSMAMGETIGYSTRLTQNNTGLTATSYVANRHARGVHIALMGDPTLRLHPVMPITNLAVNSNSGVPILNWTASFDNNIEGYAVYRAESPSAPFTRLQGALVTGTNFIDRTGIPNRSYRYMVRTVKLERSAGGTYLNGGQGLFVDGTLGTLNSREINVTSNGQPISTGDSVPFTANGTDFGRVEANLASATRTFTIANDGNTTLRLTGTPIVQISGTASGEFTIVAQPASTVAPGGTVIFQVNFAPTITGYRSAIVTIANDDPDESSFQFIIGGTSLPPQRYTVMPGAGANGGIVPTTPQTVAVEGAVTFRAAPQSGYIVDRWFVNGETVLNGSSSFTLDNVTADANVMVTFKTASSVQFIVMPGAGPNGNINPNTPQSVAGGSSITFNATSEIGFEVDQWLIGKSVAQNGGPSFTLNNVSTNTTVQATFKTVTPLQYSVIPTAGANGNIIPSVPQTVASGASFVFTAVPNGGYAVDQWLVDGNVAQNGVPIFTLTNVSANTTVQATFKAVPPLQYSVIPTAGANGNISPSAPQTSVGGSSVVFTAVPDGGYTVDQWLVNGNIGQIGGSSFTLNNVSANTTVQVTFKTNPPTTIAPLNAGYLGIVEANSGDAYAYGIVQFNTTATGALSGQASIDGRAYPFRGYLDAVGSYERIFQIRIESVVVRHVLSLRLTNRGENVTGTFRHGENGSLRSIAGERNASLAQSAYYTAILSNGDRGTLNEPVRGFVSARISRNGSARMSGYLPDGTAFSTGSHLSVTGKLPLVAGLYSRQRGFLSGETSISQENGVTAWAGNLHWTKPRGSAGIYGTGILDTGETLLLRGGRYTQPFRHARVLDDLGTSSGEALVTLSGGDLQSTSIVKNVHVSTLQRVTVTVPGNDRLVITIAAPTGLFSGKFMQPNGRQRSFWGAFVKGELDNQMGDGFFRGTHQSGRIQFEPRR